MDWYVDARAPHAMADLRREVMAYLSRHAQATDTLDEAELIFAEATGNTVRHARGPVWVSLNWTGSRPRLTVRDLGPGFDPSVLEAASQPKVPVLDEAPADGDLDLDALELAESGRGFFLITQLAENFSARTSSDGTGTLLTLTLPVQRAPSPDLDPPISMVNPLPDLSEAGPEGAFGRESFLRALVVQLARTLEYQHGPSAAQAAVAQVGTDVGSQMEAEYRLAEKITGPMSLEQIGRCYVRLKHAIDGGFRVVEADERRIVLANTRCPFGDVVKMAPSLCRMTSSVFGGIAARNSGGPVSVLLEERIAVGDPGCRIVVAFDGHDEDDEDDALDGAAAHRYRPADEALRA